jgi:hypothetical protein
MTGATNYTNTSQLLHPKRTHRIKNITTHAVHTFPPHKNSCTSLYLQSHDKAQTRGSTCTTQTVHRDIKTGKPKTKRDGMGKEERSMLLSLWILA